ncbi:hypothetical protein SAMN04488113_1681 [Alkalibacterium gilvum]|uniref:Uncharacterized protein n=1 Tax=Alkalibacterium gilvum TaxID=1130080 RepID=A0A1H6VR42_9LACT|nr:hypothetical protein [Alkalibacterium gilvum]SEJ07093.1 hypothetical protein SAMN04488113_1681 [Alkalibacterium gilvum]
MANNIKDIDKNYVKIKEILSNRYEEVGGYDFYRYLFPNNQNEGEYSDRYEKPNAIYLYKDDKDEGTERTLRRRIMLNDTWEEDYMEYVECNCSTLCSGLTYRHRRNRLENAQKMNAMVFDLDAVGEDELFNLSARIGREPEAYRSLPKPTFIVMSGTGLHIYYVFKDPIDLYPNIKLQLKQLKYDLTFRMWDYKGTSKEKTVQYQSINQGFRMVGSINDKYNLPVVAFKVGGKVSLDYLNSYAMKEENKVDINRPFRPTQYTKDEAKEKFPEWYQRVIVEGNKNARKWNIKRDLYDWWLRQRENILGGHRYFFLMCMAIYGVKCNIPKKEVRKDMLEIFDYLADIDHSNPLTMKDLYSALDVYDRGYYNFTINDIEKLTDIRIERNKRNYRKQDEHLERARAVQKIDYPENEWINKQGRPIGSGTKEELVKEYIEKNPDDNPTEIARALNISRPTVYKYLK